MTIANRPLLIILASASVLALAAALLVPSQYDMPNDHPLAAFANLIPSLHPAPAQVMAWLFPSKVICSSQAEYSDGRKIDFLKPEYFTVAENGTLKLLTATSTGCNGYSAANAADVRAHATYQFATVSSALDGMQALTETPAKRGAAIKTLTDFATANSFTGIEIDFEDFASWDDPAYQNYRVFITELGTSLHASGKKLMVDVPPIGTPLEQSYYPLTYKDMAATPADYIVVMAYDSQYDQGSGTPIAPNAWVSAIITQAKRYIPLDRLVIGIPNYAYSGPTGSYSITRTVYNDIKTLPGFLNATRDPSSSERTFTYEGKNYYYVDSVSLDGKRALIESYGIRYISVWALGGNPWF